MIRAARRPSASVGSPSAGRLAADRGVGLGDEGVEAVLVALRVAAGQGHVGGRLGREGVEVARDPLGAARGGRPRASRAAPGRSRPPPRCPETSNQRWFLRPAETCEITVEPTTPGVGLEHHRRRCPRSRPRARRRRRRRARTSAPRRARRSACATAVRARDRDDPLAGDELDQVAPVRADVGERARGPAERRASTRQLSSDRRRAASPGGSRRGAAAARRARRRGPGRGPRGRSGSSGRRRARSRPGRAARRRLDQLGGAGGVERDRLLADDVLAGVERRAGQRQVQVVRGADVDDVDLVGGDQLLGAREAALGAELGRARSRRSRGEEAATPASRAPARRAERACTRPMNPVPMIPARSVGDGRGQLRRLRTRPRSEPRSSSTARTYCTSVVLSSKSSLTDRAEVSICRAVNGDLLRA